MFFALIEAEVLLIFMQTSVKTLGYRTVYEPTVPALIAI